MSMWLPTAERLREKLLQDFTAYRAPSPIFMHPDTYKELCASLGCDENGRYLQPATAAKPFTIAGLDWRIDPVPADAPMHTISVDRGSVEPLNPYEAEGYECDKTDTDRPPRLQHSRCYYCPGLALVESVDGLPTICPQCRRTAARLRK